MTLVLDFTKCCYRQIKPKWSTITLCCKACLRSNIKFQNQAKVSITVYKITVYFLNIVTSNYTHNLSLILSS